MAHTLFRLTESLFSQPLLMTQDSCEDVLSYLDFRNSSSMTQLTSLAINADKAAGKQATLSENGIGTINIFGPISTFKTGFEALCNNTSHESIVEQATELFMDESINTVLLNIRSGGGHAHKTFESALRLRELSEETGKRLITYIDESACSAAFAHAIAAGEVVINPTAKCGSIGVLLQLIDDTKALEKAGYERTFVTSSDGKIPYAKNGGFREEFIAEMQEGVSSLYEDFISHVANLRDIDPEVIRSTNAGVYSADKAKELGFVDSIMSTHEFYEYLAEASANTIEAKQTHAGFSSKKLTADNVTASLQTETQEENLMSETNKPEASATVNAELSAQMAELLAQNTAMQEQMAGQSVQLASFQAKETALEKETLSTALDSAPFLSESKESLVSFFMNANVDEAHKTLMNSVIESSKVEATRLSTESTAALTEANGKVEEAETKLSELKTEFGETEHGQDGEIAAPVTAAAKTKLSVSEILANKKAKNYK